MRAVVAAAVLVLLYLLHFDFWLWHRPDVVLGLPVELWYQLLYCVCVAGVFALFVRPTRFRPPGSASAESSDP